MTTTLPTNEELELLPLQALLAYAARNARRLVLPLNDIVAPTLLESALDAIDAVSQSNRVEEMDDVSVLNAAERVAAAFEAAPSDKQTVEKCTLVFCVVFGALAANSVIAAARNPKYAGQHKRRAINQAQRILRPVARLGEESAIAAVQAARDDFEQLKRNGQNWVRTIWARKKGPGLK